MAEVDEVKTKEVAVLKPKKLKDGRWQVSLGITVENGRRINPRRQFKIRADALEFCNAEKLRRKAHGEITANADGVQVAQWMKLDTKMEASGVRLSDVEEWIQLHDRLARAGAGSLLEIGNRALEDALSVQCRGTVGQCYEAWAKWLKAQKRRGRYRSNARNFCANFIHGDMTHRPIDDPEGDEKPSSPVEDRIESTTEEGAEEKGWKGFGADRPMLEITPTTMKSYLQHHPGYFGVLSAWLGWASKNGWLPRNPCVGLKPSSPESEAVATFTTKQVESLLSKAAASKDWSVLAYLVLSFFGGVRPEEFRKVAPGEKIMNLTWEDYDSECISISPDLAKTRRGRIIEAEPVVTQWIEYIQKQAKGKLTGPLLPDNWIKDWRRWRKKHWPEKWPQDVLRHTYGSNHLARSQSLDVTSKVMGNSPKVLERHYWNWKTRQKDAAVFWDLGPRQVIKRPAG